VVWREIDRIQSNRENDMIDAGGSKSEVEGDVSTYRMLACPSPSRGEC